MYFGNEDFLDAFAVKFWFIWSVYTYLLNKSFWSQTKLHYENTVTDDAEKVTLIDCNKDKLFKMIFLLWEGQGNPFLSVKKWSNPLQSETLPNKILMGH